MNIRAALYLCLALILSLPVRGLRSARHCVLMSTDNALSSFESSWGRQGIGINPNLHVTHSFFNKPPIGNVRGLKVGSEAKGGSEVVSLSLKNCLVASKSRPSGKIKECLDDEVWSGLLPTTRLSIVLLNEYMQGTNNFKEYLDILPFGNEMNTPIHWNEETLLKLRDVYPQLASKVEQQRKNYLSLYTLLTTTAVGKVPFIEDKKTVPFERLVWAMESVSARAFSGVGGLEKDGFQLGAVAAAASVGLAVSLATQPSVSIPGNIIDRETLTLALGTLGALALMPSVVSSQAGASQCVLLPVIDSCNHRSTGANCEMEYDVARECFVMKVKADEGVQAGHELTLSYGNRDNDDLLMYFGFVESANPHDHFVFQGKTGKIRVTKGSREGWETPGVESDTALKGLLAGELRRLEGLLEENPSTEKDTASKLIDAFVEEKVKVLKAAIKRC